MSSIQSKTVVCSEFLSVCCFYDGMTTKHFYMQFKNHLQRNILENSRKIMEDTLTLLFTEISSHMKGHIFD